LSRPASLAGSVECEPNTLARAIRFDDLVHQFMHANGVRESGRERRTGLDITRMGGVQVRQLHNARPEFTRRQPLIFRRNGQPDQRLAVTPRDFDAIERVAEAGIVRDFQVPVLPVMSSCTPKLLRFPASRWTVSAAPLAKVPASTT